MQGTDRFFARSREEIVSTHPVTVRELLPWVVLGFVLTGPPTPLFLLGVLSLHSEFMLELQTYFRLAANLSSVIKPAEIFFNLLRNFKETSSHPEKMSNVFALLISSPQRTSSVNRSVLEPQISTGAQTGISVRIYCRQYFLKQG